MRPAVALALAAGLLAAVQASVAQAGPLDDARGRARPLVVLSDSRDDPRVVRQIQALDGSKSQLADRDIRILRESDVHGPLHRKLGVEDIGFSVVLVGKDGSAKKVWHHTVDPRTVFIVIDAMPMRKQEMDNKSDRHRSGRSNS